LKGSSGFDDAGTVVVSCGAGGDLRRLCFIAAVMVPFYSAAMESGDLTHFLRIVDLF
jgi:hypothetical protein